MCFHPFLVCVLFSGPSLLTLNFCRKILTSSINIQAQDHRPIGLTVTAISPPTHIDCLHSTESHTQSITLICSHIISPQCAPIYLHCQCEKTTKLNLPLSFFHGTFLLSPSMASLNVSYKHKRSPDNQTLNNAWKPHMFLIHQPQRSCQFHTFVSPLYVVAKKANFG